MTLKELKKMTVKPEKQYSYKTLLSGVSGTFKILEKRVLEGAEIIVLENGYVLYQSDGRVTAFTLSDCHGCVYPTTEGGCEQITEEDLDEMDWTIPVLLTGENRISYNRLNERDRYEISGTEKDEQTGDEHNVLERFVPDPLGKNMEEKILSAQHFEDMMAFLTPAQEKIARMVYVENRSLKEISNMMGTDYRAVRRMHERMLERLRKNMGKKLF